ncbi:glycosyltransferase family 2 protein [Haliea sp.]|jgi:abequosyltransferase|uniref:glycosyltransferase family 2 protein n=1 Tax=Haliea TaxID=475794 RepID=UPI000C3A4370|nr:glycosyltransferase family 2 protein [Haliea sp.]HCD56497.1 glycosyltransferase family 2 protein [Halieaceae bacterium]MAD63270.1 glycosyl transferase [Haliea sp.]MAY94202.1 glycosyl transferase [Haliea sp.]MBK40053.1 glycosyl transferase [Haliea sp.]MBP70116.1 glycosyl transferase [Haliea sp.]|tara:strand:+ start:6854 stop:7921 length:1068 start_codon:yes stop_codon:yes gene_type:complete
MKILDPENASPPPKLSICIATLNRGDVIASTLDSILAQLHPAIEIVIVDGASTDSTPEILANYCHKCPSLRYYREDKNSGVDADFDRSVHYAKGVYCWLMTDDDLLLPGAIHRILVALNSAPDLVIVDAEVKTEDFGATLQKSRMDLTADMHFNNADDLFLETAGDALSFIASVIIRRDLWLRRNRNRYYGSLFIHVGVILQTPCLENIMVLSTPAISIRYGVAMWTPRTFEIWMFKWPELIWSFPAFSDHAKRSVCAERPWRNPLQLLKHRARGSYSIAEYREYVMHRSSFLQRTIALGIARLPGKLVNFYAVLYVVFLNRNARLGLSDLLNSPDSSKAAKFLAKLFPLGSPHS